MDYILPTPSSKAPASEHVLCILVTDSRSHNLESQPCVLRQVTGPLLDMQPQPYGGYNNQLYRAVFED